MKRSIALPHCFAVCFGSRFMGYMGKAASRSLLYGVRGVRFFLPMGVLWFRGI